MRTLLTANWTNLLIATFEADEHLLKKYLPCKTELNDWNGKLYMSVVGFLFTRPLFAGIASPFYRSFEEINLRFYVRHKTNAGWHKGVVFIKEISPALIIGLMAKFLYGENFITLPLKHTIETTETSTKTSYYCKPNNEWNFLRLTSSLSPLEPSADSLQSFIRDHFYPYTRCGNQRTKEFSIEHPHWNIFPGSSFEMQLDTGKIYGHQFNDYFKQAPATAFLMDGSRTKCSFPVLL
jgi:uncharacterized protein YqjF (DUF2071 family)